MHQSRMLSSQPYQVDSCISGSIFSCPDRTASTDLRAIDEQSTYHCGVNIGSITSPVANRDR